MSTDSDMTAVHTRAALNRAWSSLAGTSRMGGSTRPVRQQLTGKLLSAASIVLVIGLWQLAVGALHVSSYLIPSPSQVAVRLWEGLHPGTDSFYPDLRSTLLITLLGFAVVVVIATPLGLALAQWELAEDVIAPFAFALQVIPMIAIAPLIILWAGYSNFAMVVIAAVTGFFPMLINAISGFKSVPREQAMMMRGLCSSPLRMFFRLKLPAALPMLLAGADMALVHCLLGTIAAEFVAGRVGLGVRILKFNSNVDVSGEFAILVILGVVAMVLHGVMNVLRRRWLFWTPSEIARTQHA
jgi:NitT/TauT family transport system permease protein